MIDSLRRKVFWSILLSASGVLLAILLSLNILMLIQTHGKKESILDAAVLMLQPEAESRGRGGLREGGKNKTEFLRSASQGELGVLLLDENNSVMIKAGCASQLEDTVVTAIVQQASGDTNGKGTVAGWDYKTVSTDQGLAVSFLAAASLRWEVIQVALLSLAAFALACCLFALVARKLSLSIVAPVAENMQMQKRFVADASHELKTPLTVIDANASVLEQSIGPNKWLGYIQEQTGRMSTLVNELLQLSHLEESKETKMSQVLESFDAAEAVMAAALPFESVAFERGVFLETGTPDKLDIQGNRQELEQLTAILIDNAVKHSTAGGTVQVSLQSITRLSKWREQPIIELRIRNSGEDIPPDALPHIFDRFYRADESRTHTDNSYGLGLAIAKGIAEKNGGTITVNSEQGITEFILQLPQGRP